MLAESSGKMGRLYTVAAIGLRWRTGDRAMMARKARIEQTKRLLRAPQTIPSSANKTLLCNSETEAVSG